MCATAGKNMLSIFLDKKERTTMPQTSINIQSVSLSGSEKHNNRTVDVEEVLHYSDPELTHKNESSVGDKDFHQSISSRMQEIKDFAEQEGGRKMRSDAKPIREAVVVIEDRHTMDDLKKLADDIKNEHGLECFQIHIHKDEGVWQDSKGKTQVERKGHKWQDMAGNQVPKPDQNSGLTWKPNLHAHMLFDFQHKESKIVTKKYKKGKKGEKKDIKQDYDVKGSVRKRYDINYSHLQTTTALSLGMERGTSKKLTRAEHLTPIEYKRQQAEKQLLEAEAKTKELQAEHALEQKKNRASTDEYYRLRDEVSRLEEETRADEGQAEKNARELIKTCLEDSSAIDRYSEEEINQAIQQLPKSLKRVSDEAPNQIESVEREIRAEERAIQELIRSEQSQEIKLLEKSLESFQRYFNRQDNRNLF